MPAVPIDGIREVVNRKTVRCYVGAAETLGVLRDGGDGQLTDVTIGMVVEAVRPHRCGGHGVAWRPLVAHHDDVAGWGKQDLTAYVAFCIATPRRSGLDRHRQPLRPSP